MSSGIVVSGAQYACPNWRTLLHISSIHLSGYKRFSDTTISSIPVTAKLVVLAGPNGSGKSSLFDGFKVWHWANGGPGVGWDESYGLKVGTAPKSWPEHVDLTMHEPIPEGTEDRKRMVYVRTAFRNEADFSITGFNRLPSPLDAGRTMKMIDNDAAVSENYQRLLMQTVDGVFDSALPDDTPKSQIRDRVIGRVRQALLEVFPDLELTGVGAVSSASGGPGTFYFTKGASVGFLYKNLSGGEKAAFDLILDAVIKSESFDNSIWCIDEPETHLNTRVQAQLLETLLGLVPDGSQLWLASHSLGFMRKAWEIAQVDPGLVTFIDMEGHDFDQPVLMMPVSPSRDFWSRTLNVALGDMASLVAPLQVVLCEGRLALAGATGNSAFDADCYRKIFAAEHPDTDFISVGNSSDTVTDRLGVGRAIQAISSGTEVRRVIDRDNRSPEEVSALEAIGVRVLPRRHLESFLFDDEVIEALCVRVQQPDKVDAALELKRQAIEASVSRQNDPDDLKRAAGDIAVGLRRLLTLAEAGSTTEAFARDTMAPLLVAGMATYVELEDAIFGNRGAAAA